MKKESAGTKQHGGVRSGAGRPPGAPSRAESVRLTLQAWEWRDAIADKTGMTKREVMELALRDLAMRQDISK